MYKIEDKKNHTAILVEFNYAWNGKFYSLLSQVMRKQRDNYLSTS